MCLFHNLYTIKVKLYSPVLALSLTSLQFTVTGTGAAKDWESQKHPFCVPQVNRLVGNRCETRASPNGSVVLKDGRGCVTQHPNFTGTVVAVLAQHWCESSELWCDHRSYSHPEL